MWLSLVKYINLVRLFMTYEPILRLSCIFNNQIFKVEIKMRVIEHL